MAKKRDHSIWAVSFVTLFSLFFVVLVSWLDAGCFFEIGYPLRLMAAGIYVALPIAVFLRSRQVQGIVLISVIWILVILPYVRWTHEKSFYVDARRISLGMTVGEVRQIMKPYLEVRDGVAFDGAGHIVYRPTADEEQWMPWLQYAGKGAIFLHSVGGWSDNCEVWYGPEERVCSIRIEKD